MRSVLPIALVLVVVPSTVSAQVVRDATRLLRTQTTAAAVDAAGTAAFAISNDDPYGTNPGHAFQVFRWNPATGAGSQITSFPGGVDPDINWYGPSATDDGSKIAFAMDQRVALINADGTGLVQLTTSPAGIAHIQIAGNGSRVVFDSTGNLTGSNPLGIIQVFAVEANGTNLRQLTSHTSHPLGIAWPSISNDGTRITYIAPGSAGATGGQLAGVLEDGTGFHYLTSVANLNPGFNQLSGNGQSVAFQAQSSTLFPPGGCQGGSQIDIVNWDGSGLLSLHAPCVGNASPGAAGAPDITDDAQTIFYPANEFGWEIYRINRNGSGQIKVTDTASQPDPKATCNEIARVAGGGSRVTFTCAGGEPWGGPNTDLSEELYAASGTGTGPLQLSRLLEGDSDEPDVTPDGSRIVFASTARPAGGSGFAYDQLYRMAPDGTGIVQLTAFTSGQIGSPAVTDAGDKIAFAHDIDHFGFPLTHIFLIGADGTGLVQLTPLGTVGGSTIVDAPDIAGNGAVVVFRSARDLLMEGGVTGRPVYKVLPNGTGLARLTAKTGTASYPRVDATGLWAVAIIGGPVHLLRVDGTSDQVIGNGYFDGRSDVTSGGGLVVYESIGNPVGTNADGNREIFLWTAATGITRQLTTTLSGTNGDPAFSPDGAWIYYWSNVPQYGWESPGTSQAYRVDVATGTSERVGGLMRCGDEFYEYTSGTRIAASTAGSLAVLATRGDCTGANADGSSEIVVIDRLVPPRIRVSAGASPTVVVWDVESGPVFYDVIRGDVASLSPGAGGTVDLGAVTCLENDSTDASTANAPDASVPAPGQVFFYLYRGTAGASAGPGSYGISSGGGQRVPSSGGCSE